MIVRLDPHGAIPPYEQVRAQIAEMIATGVVPEGNRLPTIRQLARDLGVAEGTIARAYRELERDGWIETRRRHGSFARRPPSASTADADSALREAATAFAVRVAQAGADPAEAVRVIRETLRSLPS
ncbi:MAG: GntR family transcriptional regulator [Actinomycetota bacterium]|nr:GntR family transcriptional regulator [Actinomycetota bacterium]MDH5224259.1 GntR family transcriptional regulator [Actinomycetota bacterium]MDH5312368.1 GntR family transcriptional regulator [Actinomycetota bacterium]